MSSDTTTEQLTIHNPVLPGFHPDPSILRVGTDYYIATSTFEWFPAVRLHHSTDLVTWEPMHGALTEKRLLDLTGAADSCGAWAPNLTYADGLYYLVYTDVATFLSGYWDPQNYLVTATDPAGPWSDPVVLHGRGFDASLFHDDDGTTWMLSMVADWRPGRNRFAGISIQQYDRDARQLTGPEHMIFQGTAAELTEGPNLYRINGWYYLITAEGGTSWEHQVTVARSRELLGPYAVDPAGPMITSLGRPDLTLQKAGHGSLVSTPDGEWFLAHLVARPYTPLGRCVLGRETAIQRVTWSPDGWPRVEGGIPADDVPGPGAVGASLSSSPLSSPSSSSSSPLSSSLPSPLSSSSSSLSSSPSEEADEFDAPVLGPNWSTLRRPATPDWASLTARPGFLRITGGQSAAGRQRPSMVARRVTAFRCSLETVVEFEPRNYRQLAGLTAYYNSRNWYYLHITADDDGRPVLDLLACDNGRVSVVPGVRRPLTGGLGVGLRAQFDGPSLTFAWAGRPGAGPWQDVGPALDATTLSDEYAANVVAGEPEAWGFTGAFLGLWVQDLGAEHGYADFARAVYRTW